VESFSIVAGHEGEEGHGEGAGTAGTASQQVLWKPASFVTVMVAVAVMLEVHSPLLQADDVVAFLVLLVPHVYALLPESALIHIAISFSQHFVSQSPSEVHAVESALAVLLYFAASLRRRDVHVTPAHVTVGLVLQSRFGRVASSSSECRKIDHHVGAAEVGSRPDSLPAVLGRYVLTAIIVAVGVDNTVGTCVVYQTLSSALAPLCV